MRDWQSLFQKWQQENKLLHVEYLMIKKGKFSFSSRLIQFNPDTQTVMMMTQNRLSPFI
ncbi:hypothetical protein BSG1_14555 [Bacillus sp. SG-1]|nr:hypothetical protein BSG1_14555 [Bacillus sp. SG-1]